MKRQKSNNPRTVGWQRAKGLLLARHFLIEWDAEAVKDRRCQVVGADGQLGGVRLWRRTAVDLSAAMPPPASTAD